MSKLQQTLTVKYYFNRNVHNLDATSATLLITRLQPAMTLQRCRQDQYEHYNLVRAMKLTAQLQPLLKLRLLEAVQQKATVGLQDTNTYLWTF